MIKIAFNERYVLDLPEGHRFPMLKYELIRQQLVYEGTINEKQLYDPGLCEEELVLLTHDKAYWERFKSLSLTPKEMRKVGFPLSVQLLRRSLASANGTKRSSDFALENGIAYNIAGGTHHAYTNRGEGFCLLNDIAIASNYLIKYKNIDKILIIDLDVHQGNGTAQIFQNNKQVFTFSMHGKDNYPLKKEHSDLDIALNSGTEDELYLEILQNTVDTLIDKERPDFIFYQAGVDILKTDKLGKLNLTKEGCKKRDEIVLNTTYKNGIPVAVSMGGGYSVEIRDIVDAHCNTFRLGHYIYD